MDGRLVFEHGLQLWRTRRALFGNIMCPVDGCRRAFAEAKGDRFSNLYRHMAMSHGIYRNPPMIMECAECGGTYEFEDYRTKRPKFCCAKCRVVAEVEA